MTNEEYVRAHWDGVRLDHGSFTRLDHSVCKGSGNNRVLANHPYRGATWILSANSNSPFEKSNHISESEAWAAAAEFTSERLEQIEMAQWCVTVLESHLAELDGDSRKAAYIAILEREKSALADLKRGMK